MELVANVGGSQAVSLGVSSTANRLLRIHALLDELTSSPSSHDIVELAMATAISPAISGQDLSAQVWLIVVGPPSGDKTTMVLTLRDWLSALFIDNLTENALASGYVPESGKKREPDLLERIEKKGIKCLVIKDLTTMFSLRDDKVKKLLGELQAVYDRTYSKATGTVGIRDYCTDFSILGCITPLALANHHRYMAVIGTRFLFYRVARLTDQEREEGFSLTWEKVDRRTKLEELRQLVNEHLTVTWATPVPSQVESPDQRQTMNCLADLLVHARTATQSMTEEVQREEPWRALQQLRNLGRALALVHGRSNLTEHEMELLRRVVLGSMPADRAEVLKVIQDYPDGLTAKECADGIGKGEDRARQLLQELKRIGLLITISDPSDLQAEGRPPERFRVVERFRDLVVKPIEPLSHIVDLGPEFTDETPHREAERLNEGPE